MPTRLGERVKFAREYRQLTQADLARLVGLSPQAISYMEGRGHKTGKNNQIAKVLRVSLDWLTSDNSELDDSAFLVNEATAIATNDSDQDIVVEAMPAGSSPPAGNERLIPVYGSSRAGELGEVYLDREPVDNVPPSPSLSGVDGAYAMIVLGESMRPMFKPGQIIYINPIRRPTQGKGVVVHLSNTGVLIKEYVRRTATHLILKEYHPNERELSIPAELVVHLHLIAGMEEP